MVGVLSVGSELVEAKEISDGHIPNDHAYVMLGFLQYLGVETKNLGVCPDDGSKIAVKLVEGLNKCDMVITMGGCSVGKKDIVPHVIANLPQTRTLFHGIRVSPGKVTGLSIVEHKPVVMLAGHIVTATAGFFMVALPIMQHRMGFPGHHEAGPISAKLTEDIKTKPGMARFLFARIEYRDGDITARPFGFETNLLSNLVAANSYTLVPENSDVKAGETLAFHCMNQREPVLT
ncbi:MAG: hypothetical protein HYU02_08945 [Thaumarchaeota archaeon]|nr:hypothetical protein [Nitrososphaerota archaeon]